MKKKYLTIAALGIGIVLAVTAIWLLSRHKILGNINHSFSSSEPVTNTSTVTFFAKKGDRLRFYFVSNIEQGDLELVIYDSEGNLVEELDQAKELVTYLTMHYDDTYTLAAEYTDFAGSFKAEVSAAE